MSFKIEYFDGVAMKGSCKLLDNALKTNTNDTITFPANGGTLATTDQLTGGVDMSEYATKTGTETLTNKTLTEPNIASIKNGSYTLTLPSKTATLATTSDGYLTSHQSLDACVKTSGDQTVAGVKTFSSAPKLNTNTITNSSGKAITLPSSAGTLALTSAIPSSSINITTDCYTMSTLDSSTFSAGYIYIKILALTIGSTTVKIVNLALTGLKYATATTLWKTDRANIPFPLWSSGVGSMAAPIVTENSDTTNGILHIGSIKAGGTLANNRVCIKFASAPSTSVKYYAHLTYISDKDA